MKKILSVFAIVFVSVSAHAAMATRCEWGYEIATQSIRTFRDFGTALTLGDCANVAAYHMLRFQPFDATMFDSTVTMKAADGSMLGRCQVRTVHPISSDERRALPFFAILASVQVGNAVEAQGSRTPWKTEPEAFAALRDEHWQREIKSYMTITCEAPQN